MTDASDPRELRTDGEGHTVGTQAEASPLRVLAIVDGEQYSERVQRVLSQVRGEVLVHPFEAPYGSRASAMADQQAEVMVRGTPNGYQHHVYGRGLDLGIVDDMGLAGRDFSDIERRVLAWLELSVAAGYTTRIHDVYGRGEPYEPTGRLSSSKGTPGRPRPHKVPHDRLQPHELSVQFLEAQSKLLGIDTTERLRSGHNPRGGRTVRHTGRGVSPDSLALGYIGEWREAGSSDKCFMCGEPARRGMVRPRWSRTFWYCEAHSFAYAYGSAYSDYRKFQGPEEYDGPRDTKETSE